MPLRWLLLAASARCLVVPRAPRPGKLHDSVASRPCTALHAKVVVADGFTATANAGFASLRDAWLPAVGDGDELEVHDRTAPGDVVAVLDGAAVAVVNKVRITDAVLAALPDLGLVCVTATGVNNVDLDACARRGVLVSNVPAYSTPSVAQWVAACLLDAAVALRPQAGAVAAGAWAASPDFCAFPERTFELRGRTFVAVGRGAIGEAAGAVAEALGMAVVFARAPGRGGDGGELARALAAADVVSLHVPLADNTARLVDGRFLAALKPGAILVNSARGGVVDEAALLAALDEGSLERAYLDVLDDEPPSDPASTSARLAAHPRTVVTPHTAWATNEARQRLRDVACGNIRAFLAGDPLPTPVAS